MIRFSSVLAVLEALQWFPSNGFPYRSFKSRLQDFALNSVILMSNTVKKQLRFIKYDNINELDLEHHYYNISLLQSSFV